LQIFGAKIAISGKCGMYEVECVHCILGISLKIHAVRAVCLYGQRYASYTCL
jgi:hypothetical protein